VAEAVLAALLCVGFVMNCEGYVPTNSASRALMQMTFVGWVHGS